MSEKQTASIFVQTAFLGDLLLSIPSIQKMKVLYPADKTILVCRKGVGRLLKQLQVVDEVFEVLKSHRQSYELALQEIEKYHVKVVVAPHQSTRTSLFCWKIKSSLKIGFSSFLNTFIFDTTVVRNMDLPEPVRILSLFTNADENLKNQIYEYVSGGNAYNISHEGLCSEVPGWASLGMREKIKSDHSDWHSLIGRENLSFHLEKKWILLFPGSVWATKKWTEQGFIELARGLSDSEHFIIWMGGAGEETLCQKLCDQVPGSVSLCGKTSLFETLMIISHSQIVIGNDSASTHMASVAETASLTFFGPTIPEFGFRPWQNKGWILQSEPMKCRPCGIHGHQVCPKGTHECMKSITSQKAIELTRKIIRHSK